MSNMPDAPKGCRGRPRGYTLLELLTVVAVVGLLGAIAYPTFVESARKARRSDAKTSLMETASSVSFHSR